MDFWWYKLETVSGDIFYYGYGELFEARIDKSKFGGTLTNKNGIIF